MDQQHHPVGVEPDEVRRLRSIDVPGRPLPRLQPDGTHCDHLLADVSNAGDVERVDAGMPDDDAHLARLGPNSKVR